MVGWKHAKDVVVRQVVVRPRSLGVNGPAVATLEAQIRRSAVLNNSPLTATRTRDTFFDAHFIRPLIDPKRLGQAAARIVSRSAGPVPDSLRTNR
jgi:hypothetical protein